jgi:hypothetical protein
VYPYPLPETLRLASLSPEYVYGTKGRENKTPDYYLIRLAKDWIKDIVSGESFFIRNNQYVTRAESHFFLNSKIPYVDAGSVLTLYFYAKCRARFFNHKLSVMIAEVFAVKFNGRFRDDLIKSFLDLLARTPDYKYERGMIGDLCDFVLRKMDENKKLRGPATFSFSGRTVASVVALVNEWHDRLRREKEAIEIQREAHRAERLQNRKYGASERHENYLDTSRWRGMGLPQFRHETDECIWTVTELKTAQDLLNEGRKMKSCISSYSYACASGKSSIFSVERIYPASGIIEKTATLEVNPSKRTLIQAKGKCNSALTPKIMNIVTRWAEANSIPVRLAV